ncbi:MAG: MBL fold metallo-hydrolase [Deltaproteobacteria bacterium HGW-Deltaproteobacteria-14]|jgi:rhodanese-related sulfurtransferase/glyoxylase-like metal-dependent hydrolase (beta-lactamase superfamily II)|nr:MAG: MBL fold metallo-hydrolase [Deltaproteobacteria bacterium HGW-Deltaproteobacteria-14]
MHVRYRRIPAALSALSALGVLLAAPAALASGDAEAGTHGDEAATPQLAFNETTGDFVIRQYELGCLSQLTYLIGSGGEAAVVDPQRDVDHYIRDAEALGLQIKKVILTHTNADFVAGHMELRDRVGAEILISGASGSKFPHHALEDGDKIQLGGATLEFWATPGHTLDAMTTLVHVPGAQADPAYILSGDTLFIGGIGRPDLVGGDITPAVLANKAFDSIARLKTLPDATKVLPAHGAGSLCGAHLSTDTVSTIKAEKDTNPYLLLDKRSPFVAKVVSGLPVAPQYFKHNVAMNRQGPPVLKWNDELPPQKSAAQIAAAIAKGAWILDLRSQHDYAQGHIKGSINVAVRGRLDTWTGIVVPFDADIFLVGSEAEVKEATFRLRRVGYDRLKGHVAGGVAGWQAAGMPLRKSRLVAPSDLARQIANGEEPMVVDVRTPSEYAAHRLGDYANIPVNEYQRLATTLDKKRPVILMCNSAYRSSMAVGLAEREGFEDVGSLDGGMHAWVDAGNATTGEDAAHIAANGAASHAGPAMALPEVIAPAALATALMDAPRLYTLLDVRAPWQFAEYHLPGAVNVAPEAVAAQVRALPAASRVVILDRDGTIAYAIAGAVLGELGASAPSVRVLSGGTAAYWQQIELSGGSAGAMAVPASYAPTAAPTTAPAPTPAPAPAPPARKRAKRSAGC